MNRQALFEAIQTWRQTPSPANAQQMLAAIDAMCCPAGWEPAPAGAVQALADLAGAYRCTVGLDGSFDAHLTAAEAIVNQANHVQPDMTP